MGVLLINMVGISFFFLKVYNSKRKTIKKFEKFLFSQTHLQ